MHTFFEVKHVCAENKDTQEDTKGYHVDPQSFADDLGLDAFGL